MSCTGSKKCSCGCDKPYGGYERVPLTFGDGGYISKRITDDLDKLVAEQYGGNSDLKKEALAMMNTMAYGGLTDKGSGSVDATVDPNAGLSTSAYDAGKTKDGIAFYGKKEGTFGEEVKDFARLTGKASLGLVTGAVDAVGNMAGVDINTSDAVQNLSILVEGGSTQENVEVLTMAMNDLQAENSFEDPLKISPNGSSATMERNILGVTIPAQAFSIYKVKI